MSFVLSLAWALIFSVTFSPEHSQAGDAKGNGGGALVCPGKDLEILDYYEAKLFGLGEPNFGDQGDFMALANIYLSRLGVFSHLRAQMYRNQLESFINEAVFLDDIPIGEIDDLGVILPPECLWRQIVNQNPILLPPGKRYLIDRVLWNQLSATQKVGLIFHELFYRESASKTSQGLRHLNGLLATNRLNDLTLAERVSVFKAAGLGWAEAQGLAFLIDPETEFDPIGNTLLKGTAVEGSTFVWKGQPLQLRSDLVHFHNNGSLKTLRILGHLLIPFQEETLQLETWAYSRSFLQFYENGEFREGPLGIQKTWRLSSERLNLEFKYISFDEKGRLKSVAHANGFVKLVSPSPGILAEINIKSDSEVEVYTNGAPKSFSWGSRNSLVIWQQEVFPRYGTLLNLENNGAVQNFVTDKDGRLQKLNREWITFKAGDLVDLQR